jgi:hypothetical protein
MSKSMLNRADTSVYAATLKRDTFLITKGLWGTGNRQYKDRLVEI